MYKEYDEDGYEIDEWNIDDYMDVLRDEEKEEKTLWAEWNEESKNGKSI